MREALPFTDLLLVELRRATDLPARPVRTLWPGTSARALWIQPGEGDRPARLWRCPALVTQDGEAAWAVDAAWTEAEAPPSGTRSASFVAERQHEPRGGTSYELKVGPEDAPWLDLWWMPRGLALPWPLPRTAVAPGSPLELPNPLERQARWRIATSHVSALGPPLGERSGRLWVFVR